MTGLAEDDRVVVVGAARGVGFQVVESLAMAGVYVVAVSRSREALASAERAWHEKHQAARVECIALDMSLSGSDATLRRRLSSWDSLDGLVVCAGSGRPVTGSRQDRMTKMIDSNVTPALNSLDAVEGILRKGSKSSIVLVTSIAGRERLACPPEYAASKAGLEALVVLWAAELSPVRVNAVAPGNIGTDGSVWRRLAHEDPEGLSEFLEREVPLRRVAAPQEISESILFLLSASASFVTGTTLVVDGGQSRSFS